MKKYELTDETFTVNGHTLHRIRALMDFKHVVAGDLGGFVEKPDNLSHLGSCWVGGKACVFGDAAVMRNAYITGSAKIYNTATITGDALIGDNAAVYNCARVDGNARIIGQSQVYGYAQVCGHAYIFDNAEVYNDAIISEYARIGGNASVAGTARIMGDTNLCGNTRISGFNYVNLDCPADAIFKGDAVIEKLSDFIIFKNWWSSGRHFLWTRSNNMWSVGCFYGTGDELIRKAYADSEQSGREYGRVVKYVNQLLSEGAL